MSTITTLNSGDSGPVSRGVINTNLANLNTDKAELASPVFTGTPSLPTGTTAVTQSAGDNSTKIATTAYVENIIGDVSCRVYQTAGTTITTGGTWYKMSFGAEAFDTDTMHDNATNPERITITTTGKYLVGATASVPTNNYGAGVYIMLNNTTKIAGTGKTSGYGTVNLASASTIYSFTAGDYLEFYTSSDVSSAGTSGDAETNAWAYKIN